MTTTFRQPAATGTPGVLAVELDDAHKRFGDVTAVAGVSLRIRPGEVVALLGPNGAGKTSTIDLLLGLSEPTAGTVRVYGMRPRDALARGLVSAVMQSGGLLKDYTVEETVRAVASLFGSSRPPGEVLKRAGIDHIAGRRVGRCSGGEQQRLRFAIALLSDPELLILDEPTTGMDVGGRHEFWSAIRDDAEQGRTVIFATHHLEEADANADRIILISRGRVVADGTTTQVRALASGRMLRATLPPDTDRDEVALIARRSKVDSFGIRGDTLVVQGGDSDRMARGLLTRTDAHDLEITSRNLEAAFLALTADDPNGSSR